MGGEERGGGLGWVWGIDLGRGLFGGVFGDLGFGGECGSGRLGLGFWGLGGLGVLILGGFSFWRFWGLGV